MWRVSFALMAYLFLAGNALAASVAYDFVTVDVPTGQPNRTVPPEDIDDDGTLLVNTGIGADNVVFTIDPNPRRGKNKNVSFECGDTYGTAINNGRITGYCTDGAMVRQKDGTVVILAALGTNAMGFGIARDGTVGGQFCTPNGPPNFGCTGHGFTWHPERGYKIIDYVDGRPGSHTQSVVIAPISNGRVLGHYAVLDSDNFTMEQGHYLYDNGIFDTVSLPKSFEHIGGPGAFIQDMNELGQIIIQRWNTATPRLELFDDGIFYQIAGWPPEWHLSQLNGGNNEGQFTGTYLIQVGVDPVHGNSPVYARHGFVATPAPVKRVAKKTKEVTE
jgi:hypothetical protein